MNPVMTFFRWLRSLGQQRAVKQDIDEELRFHIEQRTAENIAQGMSPEDAAREARKRFGNIQSVREECRDARGASFGEAMVRDVRFGLRMLRTNPGFTAVAVLTLAICLGANLTIFAVIDSVLLRPLPFPDSDRLVTLFNTYPKVGADRAGATVLNYYERRGATPAFSSLSIFGYGSVVVGEAGATKREQVLRVSAEFFDTLGVRPAFGRVFNDEEMTFQTDLVVILTDAYWRQHFNADPNVIERKIVIDGFPKTVVGVLPPDFRFLSSDARLVVPFASGPDLRASAARHVGNGDEIIARLKPGKTLGEAQQQMDALNAALENNSSVIADTGFRTMVASLHNDHIKSIKPTLLLLQGGVLFLLLIGENEI